MPGTNELQKKLVGIGKRHYRDVILPMLRKSGHAGEDLVAVISGSVAYGFCDELSDIDLSVYLRFEEMESDPIKANALMEFKSDGARVSYRFVPFHEIAGILGARDKISWEMVNPYTWFELKHMIPVHDDRSIVPQLQKEHAFFPSGEFVRIVRGLWITINDSGLYQAPESLARRDNLAAHVFFYRGVEALLRMIYVLNRRYFPHTKWLIAGLDALPDKCQWSEHVGQFSDENSLAARIEAFRNVRNCLADRLRQTALLDAECIESYGATFKFPFRIFRMF